MATMLKGFWQKLSRLYRKIFKKLATDGPTDFLFTHAASSRVETGRLPVRGKKRILLVEDAPENQILISHILKKNGIDVDVADNGRKALDLLNDETFDVILMDMQMPVLDGYRTTEILRKSGYLKPIISLTAHAIREDQLKCLASGCDEVLTKPVSQTELILTVTRYLNLN